MRSRCVVIESLHDLLARDSASGRPGEEGERREGERGEEKGVKGKDGQAPD
jgi:hypothetical protein